MNKVWKWILGIFVVLVVMAAVVGAGYVMHNRFDGDSDAAQCPRFQDDNGQGRGQGGEGRYPMMGGYGPMMGGRGFFPFGGGLMFLGMGLAWLFPLGLLALLVFGAFRMGKLRGWMHANMHTPAPAEAAPVATKACVKCGQSVQEDWKNCPHCGKKQ